ncbi:CD63 antigen-like isoform X2 [Prorops nasuta]|uniref:CD63 antigen-like isoform X2 n=1 Tax=Prorops nasuta TaxID=863751 RepID=UPI0034CF2559
MSCVYDCIKWLLFIFNFLLCLCGLAILAVGVTVHLQLSEYGEVTGSVVFPSVTLIIIGSVIFVIAFFGCCGAIRESHCMTVTFASFLLTILIVQVAIAVYAFVVLKNSDEEIDVSKAYKELFDKYWVEENSRSVIDAVQEGLQCCGIDSKDDYAKNPAVPGFNNTIPWSCCGKPAGENCGTVSINVYSEHKIFEEGCKQAVQTFMKHIGTILGGLALGIAGIELVGIIFALCLANSIKNNDRRNYRV